MRALKESRTYLELQDMLDSEDIFGKLGYFATVRRFAKSGDLFVKSGHLEK